MNSDFNIRRAIELSSKAYNLKPEILAALVWQESRGNPLAARFEPKFYTRYLALKPRTELAGYVPRAIPTLATEKIFRATSYGLCQIMGDTYRWFYEGKADYLDVALRDPELNLDCGASYLRYLLDRHHDSYLKALKSYNGSGKYPEIILMHVKQKTYLRLYEDR